MATQDEIARALGILHGSRYIGTTADPDHRTYHHMAHDERLAELCRRVRASDREAFAEVFRLLRPEILRYVHATIRDGTAAHDIVQDVFLGLWERRARLDPGQSIRALLYRMARNRSLNHVRARRVRDRYAAPEAEAVAAPDVPDIDTRHLAERLRRWIGELPHRQREAIELTRFAELSHREAAEVMEISPRTLNNHLVRALATLNDRLASYEAQAGQP